VVGAVTGGAAAEMSETLVGKIVAGWSRSPCRRRGSIVMVPLVSRSVGRRRHGC